MENFLSYSTLSAHLAEDTGHVASASRSLPPRNGDRRRGSDLRSLCSCRTNRSKEDRQRSLYAIPAAPPLTNLQRELLDLFALDLPEDELREVEHRLARHFAEKATVGFDALLALPNVERVEPCFRWRLIAADPDDDDKFVDTYLAAGADALVTHDAHFDVLGDLDFPPVTVLSTDGFKDSLQQSG